MSFFDDASLVFLPSGEAGKDGKAYSMKPTNGNGDFTFSRGSNLTATRVDSNGLIEKGRENLLLQSNQFDTTWVKNPSNVSITSGFSGYDGSNNAWKLEAVSDNNYSVVNQLVSSTGVETFSVYAKAGTSNFFRIQVTGGTNTSASYFDLSGSGSVGINFNNIDAKIESVGNGWFRCSVTGNKTTSSNCVIFVLDADGSTNVTTGANIYIQDAQLEIGLTSTEYIESGATTGKAGILEHSPRFDYSGGASCPSLLLEPSRSQLIPQTEYFNFSGYTTFNSTINDNATTSPEGLINAAEIAGDGSTGQVFFRENLGVPSVGNYTFSLFAKYKNNSDATNLMLNITSFGDGNGSCFFDIENGVKGTESGVTGNIEDYGNGWYRCSITTNITDGTDLSGRMQFYAANSSEGLSFSPNNANADLYIYGMQVEEGSYPTSYIPNHSGGSVTRNADVSTLLNQSGVIGQTAGTILFDAYFDEADKVNFSISDSTSSNYISIDSTSVNQVFARVVQGGSTQATINTSGSFFAEGDRLKCAIAYDDRDMAFYINGTQVGTAAPNLIPTCDDVRFARYNGTQAADQRVNRVLLFDTRISNGNLATLTS